MLSAWHNYLCYFVTFTRWIDEFSLGNSSFHGKGCGPVYPVCTDKWETSSQTQFGAAINFWLCKLLSLRAWYKLMKIKIWNDVVSGLGSLTSWYQNGVPSVRPALGISALSSHGSWYLATCLLWKDNLLVPRCSNLLVFAFDSFLFFSFLFFFLLCEDL